jgi:hypothetical protein
MTDVKIQMALDKEFALIDDIAEKKNKFTVI